MTFRSLSPWILVGSLGTSALLAFGSASCSPDASGARRAHDGTGGIDAGTDDADGASGGSGGTPFPDDDDGPPYPDFPSQPVIQDGLPTDIADQFAAAFEAQGSSGPCLAEPAMGALVPRNWTPPFFEWTAPAEQNVFELRLTMKTQEHALVVYTSELSYTMAHAVWNAIAQERGGNDDIEVTLRGATLVDGKLEGGASLGTSGSLHIAPVEAPGSVVYWASLPEPSFWGFKIGDAAPVEVLAPGTAGTVSSGGETRCVSCHVSSPDGKLVVYTSDSDTGNRVVDVRRMDGQVPDASEISPAALQLLGRNKQSAPTLSPAHYGAADAVAISVLYENGGGAPELVWTDLHAQDTSGWGVLARQGDSGQPGSPSWRHDGAAIAYVSATSVGEGVVASGPHMDIYTVPYNARAGGDATPLPGASDPNFREFYPVYSPDDQWLAFNRTDQPVSSYDQASAELFVVPSEGGTAVRLRANDPATCTGTVSPGLTNSWARWAPSATVVSGRKYYWLVFSSKRRALSQSGGGLLPQLYIAGIVTKIEPDGSESLVEDYPALYVTSQNPMHNNHIPAWDYFKVEDVPPR